MGKVPTFKAWAEKDGPFCGRTKLTINQKTNEGKDTWSMIPDLEKLCQFYHLATNLSHTTHDTDDNFSKMRFLPRIVT